MVRFMLLTGMGLWSLGVMAQDLEKKNLYYGNRAFESGSYAEAIEYYEEAVNNSPLSFKPNYNMANAYFRQKDFQKAADIYGSIIDLAPTAYDRSMVYHNLGNSFFMSQKLDEAIDAYKSALKLNPKDEDSRYNLAYALLLKQQQEQQEQQQNQNNQNSNENQNNNNQDNNQNQDNQNNDENQDNQNDPKNQDESDGDQNDKQNNGNNEANQPVQPKISKEQAKRILESALKSEKETRKKMEKNKVVGTGTAKKKDW